MATMLNYMDRQTLALTVDDIYHQFGEDPRSYGFTESAFSIAFACGAVVVGILVDIWTVYWIYPITVVAWSAAGFLTGYSESWTGLMFFRFLLGASEAGHWPCALRTTQHILTAEQRSRGNSILQSGGAVGAIITPFVVLWLVKEPSQWRLPFWVVGTLGFIWVAIWFVSVRPREMARHPSSTRDGNGVQSKGTSGAFMRGFAFMNDRRFVALGIVCATINIAWHFFRAWMTTFLKAQGYDRYTSITFNSYYYVAADIGTLSVGFFTSWLIVRGMGIHRARVLMFSLSVFLAAACVIAAAIVPSGLTLLILLLVIGFAGLAMFPNYYSFSQELTVQHQGKVTGMLSFISWTSVAAMQAIAGILVRATGSHIPGMLLAGLSPLIGLAALVLLWKQPQPAEETEVPVPSVNGAGDAVIQAVPSKI